MKLNADNRTTISQNLEAMDTLPTVVLIHGDEPQLNLEALDVVRERAKALGFLERTVYFSDEFSWASLLAECQSVSLFASQRVLEFHLTDDKLNKAATEILNTLSQSQSRDTMVIIFAYELDKPDNLAYYKALCANQLVIASKKLYPKAFRDQLQQRLKVANLQLSAEAFHAFYACYEGNLVAAEQAIRRLKALPKPAKRFDVAELSPLLSDNAQLNVFGLAEAFLLAQWQRALSMSQHFARDPSNDSKHKLPMLLNAQLHKDATLLLSLQANQSPEHHQTLFQQYKIPNFKQRLYFDALDKHSIANLRAMLKLTARLDLGLKGGAVGDYWHQLCQYLLHRLGR